MTNYYTHVCFELPIDTGHALFINQVLAGYDAVTWDGCQIADLDSKVAGVVQGIIDATDGCSLGFELNDTSDTSIVPRLIIEGDTAHLEGLAEFTRAILEHAGSMSVVDISYAQTASKMQLDAFGGGNILVSKDQIEWFPHYQDLLDAQSDMRQALSLGITASIMTRKQLYGEIAAILVRLENGKVDDAKEMAGLIVGDTRWHGAAFEEYRTEYPEEFEDVD